MNTSDLIDELREDFGIDDFENAPAFCSTCAQALDGDHFEHDCGPEDLWGDTERRAAILALLQEIGDCAKYGIELIDEDEFEEHARQLAEDIGDVPADAGWPFYCIDWTRAAKDLQADYSSVTFEGTDFLYRE